MDWWARTKNSRRTHYNTLVSEFVDRIRTIKEEGGFGHPSRLNYDEGDEIVVVKDLEAASKELTLEKLEDHLATKLGDDFLLQPPKGDKKSIFAPAEKYFCIIINNTWAF